MFLDHFQLVNKLLKCVDWVLRTLHCVRKWFTNFLFDVMFSEEALMNILAVSILICCTCSTAQFPNKSGRHLLQTPAPQNICPQQPDVPVHLGINVPVLVWVRLLSILGHIRGRERSFTFSFLVCWLRTLKWLLTWGRKWYWTSSLEMFSILDACHHCTYLERAWPSMEARNLNWSLNNTL